MANTSYFSAENSWKRLFFYYWQDGRRVLYGQRHKNEH